LVSTPFPGMDPYLEHPDLWPDVHNGLIAAIRDALSPLVRPRYYVALEERTYLEEPAELVLVGRPDLAVVARSPALDSASEVQRAAAMVEVEIPMADAVRETYLEVRSVPAGEVVTVVELLSPANKRSGTGRRVYLEKRELVFSTRTNLVEVDLLRAGEPMPTVSPPVVSEYRILISRPRKRPKADLIAFGVRDPVPNPRRPLPACYRRPACPPQQRRGAATRLPQRHPPPRQATPRQRPVQRPQPCAHRGGQTLPQRQRIREALL